MERLEKVIAQKGLASRREAKDLILRGSVRVNGVVVTTPGIDVSPTDRIQVELDPKETYLVYKPRGIETTATRNGVRDLHSVFPELCHLSPVGRLDKDSEGLILMTNDGTLTKALTRENSHVPKVYKVLVREQVSDAQLIRMQQGIKLDNILTRPAETRRLSRTSFLITLREGRKHQIRRMCDACKLTIISLERVGIGTLTPLGSKKVRKLTPEEVVSLKR